MDALLGIKEPKDVQKQDPNDPQAKPAGMTKVSAPKLYASREDLKCPDEALKAELPDHHLLRFNADVDVRGGTCYRAQKARVMKLKPYDQAHGCTAREDGFEAAAAVRLPWR